MKTFIFIPDTNRKAGLGHLHRCYKYSNFISKNHKVIFLISKNFNKKFLKKKNNYIFFSSLKNTLKKMSVKYKNIVVFLDTYNKKIQNLHYKKFSRKSIAVLDFKSKNKFSCVIDHTFGRKPSFHFKNGEGSSFHVGHENFPVYKKLKFQKRNIVLINFGSTKNKKLIQKSLIFLKNLNLDKSYKIVVINEFISKKNLSSIKLKNKIIQYQYFKNLEKIYKKTFFSIGACGISLYEKCFFNIPSVSKCVAINQFYNFKNFYSKGCILSFDRIIEMNMKKSINRDKFFKEIRKVEFTTKKYFIFKKNYAKIKKIFKNF